MKFETNEYCLRLKTAELKSNIIPNIPYSL